MAAMPSLASVRGRVRSIRGRTPVWSQKWETDANYEKLTRFLLENYTWLRPAFASVSSRSSAAHSAVRPWSTAQQSPAAARAPGFLPMAIRVHPRTGT